MQIRIPRYLHLPVQILWFQPDDCFVLLAMYVLWLVVSHWSLLIAMPLVTWAYMEIKQTRPRGFLTHLQYRYGFQRLDGYPSPTTRRHHE